MKVLRVRIDAPWSPSRSYAWALRGQGERAIQEGVTPAAQWPAHDALECVIAASQVRVVRLQLPPLPAARVDAAARFALEDQIAAAESAAHVAVSKQASDGTVLAIICPREVVTSFDTRTRELASLQCLVAEPELAPPVRDWRWCQGDLAGGSFVRLPDGSSIAVSEIARSGTLPAELALALAQDESGPTVRVEWNASAALVTRWQEEYGVTFVAAPPFRWQDAAIPAHASNVLRERARDAERPRASARAILAPAAWILACAALLQVLAMFGEWVALRIDTARSANEWRALASAADLPRDAAGSPEAVAAALARKHDDVLHAHHRFSSRDALTLLARASSAMSGLPAGALKRATYQSGYWTFELEGTNATSLGNLESALRAASLEAQVVPTTTGGARVRFGAAA